MFSQPEKDGELGVGRQWCWQGRASKKLELKKKNTNNLELINKTPGTLKQL